MADLSQRLYPFHAGEQEMNYVAGSWQEAESLGRRMIKRSVGSAHADALQKVPLLLVTAVDGADRLWASALLGAPGFIRVDAGDPSLVCISNARLLDGGALCLPQGGKVGCLCLLPSSRRRVRINGRVERVECGSSAPAGSAAVGAAADGTLSLLLRVDQCYSNCPRYIQKRQLQLDPGRLACMGDAGSAAARGAGALGPLQRALVSAADTFFIASSSAPVASLSSGSSSGSAGGGGHLPPDPAAHGCDVSHRGGDPGFVQVLEGNLLAHPACALLFMDWSSGDALLAAGTAEVLHKDRELPGARRSVRFRVQHWAHLPAAVPLRQAGETERSPFNP